jgi:hypothetical protein
MIGQCSRYPDAVSITTRYVYIPVLWLYPVWTVKTGGSGSGLVTRVDIILLELAQEPDHEKNVLLDAELESWKNILKKGKDIYIYIYIYIKVDFFQNWISGLNFMINYQF